jgi:hydantoinase/carbamoylase family amidase
LHTQQTLMPNLKVNSARLQADFEDISRIGLKPNGAISRPALSREDLEARAWFADRIEEAGFFVKDDDAGNLSGIYHCDNPDARTLLVGAHLDTVQNAGRYDGVIGIIAALECLRTIKEAGIWLPVHLEVIDFTDDEGTWQPMFGSMSLTGRLAPDALDDKYSDRSTFRAALTRAGINPNHVHRARRSPASLLGYMEVHVEQGCRLEQAGVKIGVVTRIVGRRSFRVVFFGQAGHAGTVSMFDRRDALQGAALFITQAHELVRQRFPEGVLNCGDVRVKPGSLTIIPSEAAVIIEARHVDEDSLSDMQMALAGLAQTCAEKARLGFDFTCTNHIPVALMDERVQRVIERACQQVNTSFMLMPSHASHNAQVMSSFVPSGMFFIPSVNGISHNPDEFTLWEDVVNGTNVLLHAILGMALEG